MSIGGLTGLTVGVAKEVFKKFYLKTKIGASSNDLSELTPSAQWQKFDESISTNTNGGNVKLEKTITDFVIHGMGLGLFGGALIGAYAMHYKPTFGIFPLLLSHKHPDFGDGTALLLGSLSGMLTGGLSVLTVGIAKDIFKKLQTSKTQQV